MKILELAFHAFGPFTDVTFDLSAGQEGLHLIYGPNEAGKSSALRALRQALFGIPAQSPDDFLHPYAKLRIGLTLRADDGHTLQFIRRKGNRNTLLAVDGTTPLADGTIERFLGGLSESEFKSRFALDHDELIQGGKTILEGGGELGAVLFQAGGGLKNLVQVRRELDRELNDLFKRGASRPRINAGLAELKEANDAKHKNSLHSREWIDHDRARKEAAERLEPIDGKLNARHAEKRRLERLQAALPLVTRQQTLEQELTRLGDAVLLSDVFQKTRLDAQVRRDSARITAENTQASLARLDGQIANLAVPAELLAEAEAIERLQESMAAARKARRSLPAEEADLMRAMANARDLLEESWPHLLITPPGSREGTGDTHAELDHVLKAAEQLRQTRAQKSTITRLTSEWTKLTTEQAQNLARILELTGKREQDQSTLSALAAPLDPGPLDLALRQAREQGDLDQSLEVASHRVTDAENEAARALTQLPLWTGSLEALETASVPTIETMDRFESAFAQIDRDEERIQSERRETTAEQADAESALERLRQIAGAVPTEDDLAHARTVRDRLWKIIRRSWETHSLPDPGDVVPIFQPAPAPISSPGPLADAFERLENQADVHADRLHREADRVAQQATSLANLQKARQHLDFLTAQEKQMYHRAAETRDQWRNAWADSDFEPLSPREMRGWLQVRKDLLKQAAELQSLRTEQKRLDEKRALHRQKLWQCLQSLGLSSCQPGESLATIRAQAETEFQRITELQNRHRTLGESVRELDRQLEDVRARGLNLERLLKAWRLQWTAAVGSLSLPPDTPVEEAAEITSQATDLQSRTKEARESQRRIALLTQEVAQFAGDLRDLCRRVAADLSPDETLGPLAAESAASELLGRFRKAQETWTSRQTLLQQRESELANAQKAEQSITEANVTLAVLCREVRVDTADDLPRAEQRSKEALEARDRLKVVGEQIAQLAAGEPLEAFRQEAMTLDIDRLPEQLHVLEYEISQLQAERDELNQVLGREEQVLRQMDGSSRAAEAAEQAEELKARLAGDIDEYARLRLATLVLHEAIDRYRQRSQGPVLDRASRLFAHLTLGSFQGLKVNYDDHDQSVLQAVRAGGTETVGISGLSDGSADQLYLALRLASLETYLESHEPVPLVVDDILIQFDDDRATAALQALAGLSRRAQVVIFSHHEHICRLAQACIDPGQLIIHRLPGRAAEKNPFES